MNPLRLFLGCPRLLAMVVGLFGVLGTSLGSQDREPPVDPIPGPTVVRFDSPLGGLREKQYGVFRNDDEPPRVQHIEEVPVEVGHRVAGRERTLRMLALPYHLTKNTFNGFWIKLGDANWEKYAKGDLVLVLRRMSPMNDPIRRTVRLNQPDTECLSALKVELKSKDKKGEISTIGLGARFDRRHTREQDEKGYCTLRIPLEDFSIPLTRMNELVLVFEASRVDQKRRTGALAIRAIVVTPRKGQSVATLINEPDPYQPEALLDRMGEKVHEWFRKYRHPVSGQVLDRGPNDVTFPVEYSKNGMSSIAATGFYLTLLPEWERLGYITKDEAIEHAKTSMQFVLDKIDHHDGVLPHFVDWISGKRLSGSEYSVLDSSIFFNGCMVVSQAYGGEIEKLANALLKRVNWTTYLLKPNSEGKRLLSMGWSPKTESLLGPADVRSSELAMAYYLATGAEENFIPPACWHSTKIVRGKIQDREILNPTHGLFTSYYGLCWHDLRDRKAEKENIDFPANAKAVLLACRAACRERADRFKTYSEKNGGFYGISAGDNHNDAYVAPSILPSDADGHVWPITALAAIPFAPDTLTEDLGAWRKSPIWDKVSQSFGITPFRIGEDRFWQAKDLIAIDLGSYGAGLANHRNETIWKLWMAHPIAKSAMTRLGYSKSE